MKKIGLMVILLVLIGWPGALVAGPPQEKAVKDVVVLPRVVHGGDPQSKFCFVKVLPVVAFSDAEVSHPGQFANRHDWALSEDGEEPLAFGSDDFFELSFDLVLVGTPPGTKFAERKEAGIIITTSGAGEGQYLVNTDAHEVVAFGGPFPFFKFDLSYNSGDVITLGIKYFKDLDGTRKIIYRANDKLSPALALPEPPGMIPGPFFIKGYIQTVINTEIAKNSAAAGFANIRWNGKLLTGGTTAGNCQ
jgi:hypothetical protein